MHTPLTLTVTALVDGDTRVEVRSQTSPPSRMLPSLERRIVALYVGEYDAQVKFQGSPADMLALVERLRGEVIASIGEAWPVEMAHEGVSA